MVDVNVKFHTAGARATTNQSGGRFNASTAMRSGQTTSTQVQTARPVVRPEQAKSAPAPVKLDDRAEAEANQAEIDALVAKGLPLDDATEMVRLRAQNERLKARINKGTARWYKCSEKGCLQMGGGKIRRFGMSFYASEWSEVIAAVESGELQEALRQGHEAGALAVKADIE